MTFWKTWSKRSTLRSRDRSDNREELPAAAVVDISASSDGDGASSEPQSIGEVETRQVTFDGLKLENGPVFGPLTLAYECYGELNERRNNAVLCCHALSGDAHAAGYHRGVRHPGWWDLYIGPGKAFDTDRYFVVCSNVMGGCQGSTGPSSPDPATGRPYGLRLPILTVADFVNAQKLLINHLGIERLLCVAGGSMGGMQALDWTVRYPDAVRAAVVIASSARHSPQQIAFNEVGRQAIMADPNWNGGDYYDGPVPSAGLSVARMIGHITYLSEEALHHKFARRLQDKEVFDFHFKTEFQVESYLRHQGDKFVERFDANSYLYITRALDYFDLAGDGSLEQAFARARARYLMIAFSSDWLYPAWQMKELARSAKHAGRSASYLEIDTPHGHDAFLLENDVQAFAIRHFLAAEQGG